VSLLLRDGRQGPCPTPELQPYRRATRKLRLHVDEAHYRVPKHPRPLLPLPSFPPECCFTIISAQSTRPKQTQVPQAGSRESSCTELEAPILRDPLFAVSPEGHVRRRLSWQRPCAWEPGSRSLINPSARLALPQLEMQIQLLQHQTLTASLCPSCKPPRHRWKYYFL